MVFKEDLFKKIKELRDIKDNTIKNYIINLELTNLYFNQTRIFNNLDFLLNKNK